MLESTRLAQPGSEKRDSAATMENIAESTGRACASGTLGVNFDLLRNMNLNRLHHDSRLCFFGSESGQGPVGSLTYELGMARLGSGA